MTRMYYGVAINDMKESYKSLGMRTSECPINRKWRDMIRRCYDQKRKASLHPLSSCTVCDEWLVFSNFLKWAERQDYEGKELDKDILSGPSKIYSPDTCLFVDRKINMLVVGLNTAKGYCFLKSRNKFYCSVKNSITDKLEFIGLYDTEEQAKAAYTSRKKQIIHEFAQSMDDKFLAEKLLIAY